MRINFFNECRLWFFSDVFDTRYSFHVPCSVDDNLSHVNQHSWDCSSGPPYTSNASSTMRLGFRIHVFTTVQRGCTQQFVRFVKYDIRRRETRPGITPNCILHTLCYDRTRYRKIVCNCPADSILYSPSIRLPFLKFRPGFFSRASHLSSSLQYLPLY